MTFYTKSMEPNLDKARNLFGSIDFFPRDPISFEIKFHQNQEKDGWFKHSDSVRKKNLRDSIVWFSAYVTENKCSKKWIAFRLLMTLFVIQNKMIPMRFKNRVSVS